MLPHPLTHVSGFASLNKGYLAPHDTVHAIVQAGHNIHGTAELTWGSPTKSRPAGDGFVITGSKGWISVNQTSKPGTQVPIFRAVIHAVAKSETSTEEEKEEIIEEPSVGVLAELTSFFAALKGQDDGKNLGDPLAALSDVAFFQAIFKSKGSLVDLKQMLHG